MPREDRQPGLDLRPPGTPAGCALCGKQGGCDQHHAVGRAGPGSLQHQCQRRLSGRRPDADVGADRPGPGATVGAGPGRSDGAGRRNDPPQTRRTTGGHRGSRGVPVLPGCRTPSPGRPSTSMAGTRWISGSKPVWLWCFWNLRTVPNYNDPDSVGLDPVEEAVRRHKDFPVGKLRELGQDTAGIRISLKASEGFLRADP